jgi:hypothetical protein
MLPLRIFLSIRSSLGEYSSSVHRDLESVLIAWKQIYSESITGILQVGFNRLDSSSLEWIAKRFPGKILLSAPAKYIFEKVGKCSANEAGLIEGVPFFVAISGWGYETILESAEALENHSPRPSIPSNITFTGTSAWLNEFKSQYPDEMKFFVSNGIVDDQTYIEKENILSDKSRYFAGAFRFRYLLNSINPESPQEILSISPPWVLDCSLDRISLTVRCSNILVRLGLAKVSDLRKYPDYQLVKIKGFGRKSLVDLANSLSEAIGVFSDPQYSEDKKVKVPHADDLLIQRHFRSFTECLDKVFAEFEEQKAFIMHCRMGFVAECKTLQEIGDYIGISRERVRQIEQSVCLSVRTKPVWKEKVEASIKNMLSERESGLPLVGLEVIDPWFIGVDKLVTAFEYVLENFCQREISLIRTQSDIFVSTISQVEWDAALERACQLLEGGVSQEWTQSVALQMIRPLLTDRGKELGRELFLAASEDAFFSAEKSVVDPVLVGFGRKVDAYVEAVLMESDRPLHYSEIAERVAAKGRVMDPKSAHISAQRTSFLFGRGTYGLLKHFKFSDAEAEEIVLLAEELISSNPERQWHCSEICEFICEKDPVFSDRLNFYLVNVALFRSKTLNNLGRLVWTGGSTRLQTTADRIDRIEAVEALLMDAGRPMTTEEIRERILVDRGLGRFFQIFQEGNLVRLAHGLWGLLDRDIPFTKEDRGSISDALHKELVASQRGIHHSEVHGIILKRTGIDTTMVDEFMVFAIAKKTGLFKVLSGGYLCLTEWESAQRLKPLDAVRTLFETTPGGELSMKDLKAGVSKLIGRDVQNGSLYVPLESIGAKFNESTGLWHVSELDSVSEVSATGELSE